MNAHPKAVWGEDNEAGEKFEIGKFVKGNTHHIMLEVVNSRTGDVLGTHNNLTTD